MRGVWIGLALALWGMAAAVAVPSDAEPSAAPASTERDGALTAGVGSSGADVEAEAERLVGRLNVDSFAERDQAMIALADLGTPAVPVLQRHADSEEAEIRWRVRTALTMIRWQIPAEVCADVVPLVSDYDALDWIGRQKRLREISAAGRKLAIPVLVALLRTEQDDRVRRTIVRILAGRNMWPDGLSALRDVDVPGIDLGSLVDPRVLITIGNAFLRTGDYDRALREYERAIVLLPNEPVVLYNIGCIYALRGEVDTAFDYLTRSVHAGYDDVEWLKRDPDLKGLHDDARFDALVDLIRRKALGEDVGAEGLPGTEPPGEQP